MKNSCKYLNVNTMTTFSTKVAIVSNVKITISIQTIKNIMKMNRSQFKFTANSECLFNYNKLSKMYFEVNKCSCEPNCFFCMQSTPPNEKGNKLLLSDSACFCQL